MTTKFQLTSLAAVLAALAAGNALALEPDYIKLGDSLMFTPTLLVTESYDDNFRANQGDTESSWITTVTPTFMLGAEGRKGAYRVTYQAVSDTFHSSQQDNNTDHHLTADAALQFNARNRLVGNLGHHRVEETAALEVGAENDRYTTDDIGAVYSFGAQEARAQVDVGAKYSELRYLNNVVNEDKERDTTTLNSIFYYRIGAKTKALVEVRHIDVDYLNDTSNRSGQSLAYLGGLTWDATAKTTGTVKIGREKKDYDAASVDSQSNGMVEAGISWQPRTYSTFSLTARKAQDEGDQNGATSVDTESYNLSWDHEWTELVKSNLFYGWSERDYNGSIERSDENNSYGASLTYSLRRWLDLGIGYRYSDNDSTFSGQSFERNIYQLSVSASL